MAQFIRYCIVGAVNTVFDFGLYTFLTRGFGFWREHYLLANAVTFVVVVTWSFFWNKYWTFKNRDVQHGKQYLRFVIVTLVGLGIAEGVLFIGVHFLSIYDIVSKVIAAPLVVAWNFSAYRFWTFKPYTVANNEGL